MENIWRQGLQAQPSIILKRDHPFPQKKSTRDAYVKRRNSHRTGKYKMKWCLREGKKRSFAELRIYKRFWALECCGRKKSRSLFRSHRKKSLLCFLGGEADPPSKARQPVPTVLHLFLLEVQTPEEEFCAIQKLSFRILTLHLSNTAIPSSSFLKNKKKFTSYLELWANLKNKQTQNKLELVPCYCPNLTRHVFLQGNKGCFCNAFVCDIPCGITLRRA